MRPDSPKATLQPESAQTTRGRDGGEKRLCRPRVCTARSFLALAREPSGLPNAAVKAPFHELPRRDPRKTHFGTFVPTLPSPSPRESQGPSNRPGSNGRPPVPDPRRTSPLPAPPVSRRGPTGLASVFGASRAHSKAKGCGAGKLLSAPPHRRLSSSVSLKNFYQSRDSPQQPLSGSREGTDWLLGGTGAGQVTRRQVWAGSRRDSEPSSGRPAETPAAGSEAPSPLFLQLHKL